MSTIQNNTQTSDSDQIRIPFKVYIGFISTGYLDPQAIEKEIRDGLSFCSMSKKLSSLQNKKILIQADANFPDSEYAPYHNTHSEIIAATLKCIKSFAPQAQTQVLSREFSKTLTQKFNAKNYHQLKFSRYLLSKADISTSYDHTASQQATYRTTNSVLAPSIFSEYDFHIGCPKIKTSIFTKGISAALALGKNTLEFLDEPESANSDRFLIDQIEICDPELIISDGIIVPCGGHQILQNGQELGIILISNNALAHDWIAATLLNLDPEKIPHLQIAKQRGWGPRSVSQIEIGPDREHLELIQEKTKNWDLSEKISDLSFQSSLAKESPLDIYSFSPRHSSGPHGKLLNWLNSSEKSQIKPDPTLSKVSVIMGNIEAKNIGEEKKDLAGKLTPLVFLFGKNAIESFGFFTEQKRIKTNRVFSHAGLISSIKINLRLFKGTFFQKVQLKNGAYHFIVCIEKSESWQKSFRFGVILYGLFHSMNSLFGFSSTKKKRGQQNFWSTFSIAIKNKTFYPDPSIESFDQKPLDQRLTKDLKHNRWWTRSKTL